MRHKDDQAKVYDLASKETDVTSATFNLLKELQRPMWFQGKGTQHLSLDKEV